MARREKIIRNRVKCAFVYCKCRSIFVDGGKDYLRRGGDLDNIIELSEVEEV